MSPANPSQQNRPDSFVPVDPSIVEREKAALFHMMSELNIVQRRLGTSGELARDAQRARDLGHGIRNKLQVLRMWRTMGMIKSEKPDPTEQLQAS